MSNFQSKTKEVINTAAAAGALYKDTPEAQFKEMGEAIGRLYGKDKSKVSKNTEKPKTTAEELAQDASWSQRNALKAETAGHIYGVQWERNKVAQERISKLIKQHDKKINRYKSNVKYGSPEDVDELNENKDFINLISSRNRIAAQFGIPPIGGAKFNADAYMKGLNEEAMMNAPEPVHLQTKVDDEGHQVYPTVSKSKQPDWKDDMLQHGQDRYQGRQADAMRSVLQRRFAKIPNPMTVAQFKGGPEW